MKTAMSGLMVAILVAASVPATAEARERGVSVHPQYHPTARIREGFRHGDLTRGEARNLRHEAYGIRREAHAFRSDGRFTRAERREVHRDLHRFSRDIRRERHDGDRRFAHDARPFHRDDRARHAARGHDMRPYPARRGWNARQGDHSRSSGPASWADRTQDGRHDGVASGASGGESARSGASTAYRASQAHQGGSQFSGALTRADRTDLSGDVNAAGQHIYNETRDAHSRR